MGTCGRHDVRSREGKILMKQFKALSLITLLITGFSSTAQQLGEYNQWLSVSSKMNWSSGMVTAEGFGVAPEDKRQSVGRLLACRAAVTDAQRNLLESIKGVKVTVETNLSSMADAHDSVKSAVDGVVKGAAVIDRELVDEETCKVVMGVFVDGKLTQSVYEQSIQDQSELGLLWDAFFHGELGFGFFSSAMAMQTNTSIAVPEQLNNEFERLDLRVSKLEASILTANPALEDAKLQDQPSGLIIDVRGYRFMPSMTPELLKPNGKILYPSIDDKQSLIESGKLLSLFSRSLEFAMNHPIVGDKPLLIKAQADSSKPSSIKLTSANAIKLAQLANDDFFATPKIIIVLD